MRHRSSFAFSPLDQPAASSCAEFPFPPKGILTLGIKHPLDMTVSAFMIAIRAHRHRASLDAQVKAYPQTSSSMESMNRSSRASFDAGYAIEQYEPDTRHRRTRS